MKISLIFAFVLLIIFSISSCKKEFECECTYKIDESVDTTMMFRYKELRKKNAEDLCITEEKIKQQTDANAVCKLL